MNNDRSESLKKAWKSRKDYIGPEKKSSLYTTWRARVFTLKGKTAGFPESWMTFKGFRAEMLEGWTEGKILVRHNTTLPFSKENCEWVDKGEESLGRLTALEYNGQSKTLLEWCREYDLNYTGVRQRCYKGRNYTPEQILFGKRSGKPNNIHDYQLLDMQKRKNKISCMLSAYKLKDKKHNRKFNITKKFFEEKIISQPCIYCGSTENVGCDRIDNKLGHTINNVVPACYICNTVRNDHFTFDEMKIIGNTIKSIREAR